MGQPCPWQQPSLRRTHQHAFQEGLHCCIWMALLLSCTFKSRQSLYIDPCKLKCNLGDMAPAILQWWFCCGTPTPEGLASSPIQDGTTISMLTPGCSLHERDSGGADAILNQSVGYSQGRDQVPGVQDRKGAVRRLPIHISLEG